MTKKLLSTLLICFVLLLFGQKVPENAMPGKVFPLNTTEFSAQVKSANSAKGKSDLTIKLPLKDGRLETFTLTQNDLTKNTSLSIKTFDGISKDGKTTLKLSFFGD